MKSPEGPCYYGCPHMPVPPFKGKIRHVKVYRRMLTDEEVWQHARDALRQISRRERAWAWLARAWSAFRTGRGFRGRVR